MRIALHTGKGGVGKTTIATVTAIAAARSGHRTLLLSTDPAHSVADVLDIAVGADPGPVPGVEGLWAAHVDVRARFEQAWSSVRGYLVNALASRGVAAVQAEELTVLPGADEVIALLELHRYATEGEFDVIVVDCAPTGETLRLLALPETISFYADKLMGAPARLMRTLAAGLAGLSGRRGAATSPDGEVRDALSDLLERLTAARDLLSDPTVAGIRLVMTPERVVVAEARRLWTALSLHGFCVEAAIVNRLLPANLDSEMLRGWQRAQERAMEAVDESFHSLPLHRVRLEFEEPIGVQRLGELAERMFGTTDPVAALPPRAGITVSEAEEGYVLRFPLPLLDRGTIDLSRTGDDLVVTVGPHRRRMTLPSLLRRCQTVGARFEGDDLLVEFVPDPRLWPSALLPEDTGASDGTDGAEASGGRENTDVAETSDPRLDLLGSR